MKEDFVIKELDNFMMLKQLDTFMIGHKGYIAGGVFKNILNGEKFKDVDIFFENALDQKKAEMYYDEHEDYKEHYKNGKVKAYIYKPSNIRIELVKSVFGKPIDIIENFDFTIVKFAYYKEETLVNDEIKTEYKIVHHKDLFEHLFFKRLVAGKDLKYPNSTFERMIRYVKYGYMPCKETKMNIINAIKDNTNILDTVSQSLYDGVD